jgi:hypothetical protein
MRNRAQKTKIEHFFKKMHLEAVLRDSLSGFRLGSYAWGNQDSAWTFHSNNPVCKESCIGLSKLVFHLGTAFF